MMNPTAIKKPTFATRTIFLITAIALLIANSTMVFANAAYGTTKQKNMAAAQKSTDELYNAFGGKEKFYSTDFSVKENYDKAYPYLAQIEEYQGIKLSGAEKKEISNIRQLIALSDVSKNLSKEDTGLWDNYFGKILKYTSADVKGLAAKSTYAALRNIIRHALYGSTLTDTELESFNEQMGNLDQKLGPVLEQFKTSLIQVQSNLGSIQREGNPTVMHIRLGADQDKMDRIIKSLEQSIKLVSSGRGPIKEENTVPPVSPELKKRAKELGAFLRSKGLIPD